MTNICDAIMGSGKSSAAITYINEHPDLRFIYLAPYLEEARRIKDACPEARFVEPKAFQSTTTKSKTEHSYELIQAGRNIVSTHEALMRYTPGMMDRLREMEYTVIIDEVVNVLSRIKTSGLGNYYDWRSLTDKDIETLVLSGYIYEVSPNEYARTDKDCEGFIYSRLLKMMESRSIVRISPEDNEYCWLFHPDLFRSAKDVFVLTYMFPGSEMEQFLKVNALDYRHIGIARDKDDTYRFADTMEYVPEYVSDLPNMIHICDRRKLNAMGDDRFSFSENWFKLEKNQELMPQLKKNQQNFFQHYAKNTVCGKRMIGTYKDNWDQVKGAGFGKKSKNQVMFNRRAENRWGDYTALSYPVNVFTNPFIAKFYESRGGHLDENAYALSTMVQWIWRSAIRNGKEIYLYVPSSRMRQLLIDWINKTSITCEGG